MRRKGGINCVGGSGRKFHPRDRRGAESHLARKDCHLPPTGLFAIRYRNFIVPVAYIHPLMRPTYASRI